MFNLPLFKKWFRFKKFRTRIIVLVLLLSVPLQVVLFVIIRDANITTARANIDEALQVTADIFVNTITQRKEALLSKVRALSSDYAFKPAANTNEHKTVLSTLLSYQRRANADIMLLLTMSGDIIADTKHPELTAQKFYLPLLIAEAMDSEYGEADVIDFIDQLPYLLVAVPLFSPEPSHWVIIGFLITDEFANHLQQSTRSQVSLLFNTNQTVTNEKSWRQLSSTLGIEQRVRSEQILDMAQTLFTDIKLLKNKEEILSQIKIKR